MSSKRGRKESKSGSKKQKKGHHELISMIRDMEKSISSGDAQAVNQLADLVEYENHKNMSVAVASGHAVHRALVHLGRRGMWDSMIPMEDKGSTPLVKVKQWILEQANSHIKHLLKWMRMEDELIQNGAIDLLLRLVRSESGELRRREKKKKCWMFGNQVFLSLCASLVDAKVPNGSRLISMKIAEFADLKLYFMQNLATMISTTKAISDATKTRMVDMMLELPPPISEEALGDVYVKLEEGERTCSALRLKAHRKAWGVVWTALLSLELPLDVSLVVLERMREQILPFMTHPKSMMDFLADSYSMGGERAVAALNGLFYLIHEHGLDYPKFYEQVLRLWTGDVFRAKYRARFFELCDLFLSSTHLPAYVAAAFLKRMSRLAMMAPPYGALVVIPLMYNVIKRHPACLALIHRVDRERPGLRRLKSAGPLFAPMRTDVHKEGHVVVDAPSAIVEELKGADPFVMEEEDPAQSHAMESSLWELEALLHHYDPSVARMAKVFEGMFTKPSYDVANFSEMDYGTLMVGELKRKEKGGIPTAFRPPSGLVGGASWEMWGT